MDLTERIVLLILIIIWLLSIALTWILIPRIEYKKLVKKYGKETAQEIWRRINMI